MRELKSYLFSCHTGVRISDIAHLSNENIIGDELVFIPHKTRRFNRPVRIPLLSYAKKLIEGKKGLLLEKVADQKMNENLKLIAEKAKISKELSFHTARHTFATLFLAAGGNIAVLKELMGHAAIKTTMVYVHIDAEQRKQQMSLMESL